MAIVDTLIVFLVSLLVVGFTAKRS
jgi:hypothetical protein